MTVQYNELMQGRLFEKSNALIRMLVVVPKKEVDEKKREYREEREAEPEA
jgi:hypothetical protein